MSIFIRGAQDTNFHVTSLVKEHLQVKTREMEDLDFVVDTKASDNSELIKTFNSPFPIFSGSKFTLGDAQESEQSENHEDDDEYFGLLIILKHLLPC